MSRALALAITCCTACRLGFNEQRSSVIDGAIDGAIDARADAAPADISGDARIVTHTFGERTGSMTTGVTIDTSLSEPSPNQNVGPSEDLSISGSTDIRERGLLRFNLSSIAAGTPVVAARLELELVDFADDFVGNLALRVVGEPWEENAATWNLRASATAWTSLGGNVSAVITAIPTPTGAFAVTVPVTIPQSWIDAPNSNFGIAITDEDETTDTHYHVHSSESLVVTARPLLVLDLAE